MKKISEISSEELGMILGKSYTEIEALKQQIVGIQQELSKRLKESDNGGNDEAPVD